MLKLKHAAAYLLSVSMLIPSIPAVVHGADSATEWKFDFGAENQTAVDGYYSVTPNTEFQKNIVDGFQFGLIGQNTNDYKMPDYEDGVTTKQGQYVNYAAAGTEDTVDSDKIGIGDVPEGQIEGVYPVRFAMAAENNGYYEVKVTVTGLDSTKSAVATVYSERRHPIITNKTIAAGATETVEFTASPQNVLVKDRANGGSVTYKDNKLNVMAVGENIAISSIEVKKVAHKTTVWCYDDSTGCDYPMLLPYFPLQNYGGTAQYLSKYLSKDIALVNQGDGGIAANALSYFNCAKENIQAGDYIYLQYGHNHKKDGPVGYVQYLHHYYDYAHQKGAKMIYVGPIDRHNEGQYNSADNTWKSTLNSFSKTAEYYTKLLITRGYDTAEEFSAKAKEKGGWDIDAPVYEWADGEIAKGIDSTNGATDVAFVDLNQPTLDWLSAVCDEVKSIKGTEQYSNTYTDYYFRAAKGTTVDGTHENDYGADFTASFFFDGVKALINKDNKDAIEQVEANVLAPLIENMRTATPDKVTNEIINAGAAPNSAYPQVYQSSNISELPVFIKDVKFNDNGTINSVKVLKQEAKLTMNTYGVVEIKISGADGQLKGTIYSSQVDNTWSDGSVTELTEFTGDTSVILQDGDTYTAKVYRAPDSTTWPKPIDYDTAYSDFYVPTDIEGVLITNEDGAETEDFNYYTAIYDETAPSNLNGNNGWYVGGSGIGNQKLGQDADGRCYANIARGTGNSCVVFRNFDSSAPKIGIKGKIELNIDMKYVSGSNIHMGFSKSTKSGSPFFEDFIDMIIIGNNGSVTVGSKSAGSLSKDDWTTVNLVLDMDYGTATVKVGNNEAVTESIKNYDTIDTEITPSGLGALGFNFGTKNSGIQISNLSLKKYKDGKLPAKQLTVAASNNNRGTVTASVAESEMNTAVTIKAEPADNCRFIKWVKNVEGDGGEITQEDFSTDAEYTFRLREDLDLTAVFVKDTSVKDIADYTLAADKTLVAAKQGETAKITVTDIVDSENEPIQAAIAEDDISYLCDTKGVEITSDGTVIFTADFELESEPKDVTVTASLNNIEKTVTFTAYPYSFYETVSGGKTSAVWTGSIGTIADKSCILIDGDVNDRDLTFPVPIKLGYETEISFSQAFHNNTLKANQYRSIALKDSNDNNVFNEGFSYDYAQFKVGNTVLAGFSKADAWDNVTIKINADGKTGTITFNDKTANLTVKDGVTDIAYLRLASVYRKTDKPLGITDIKITQTNAPSAVLPYSKPSIVIDYENETLTGFSADNNASYTISVNDGEAQTASPDNGMLAVGDYMGTTLSIVKKGNNTTTIDSVPQKLPIPNRPDAPTGVSAIDTTDEEISDGKITGVNAEMEYKLSTSKEWTPCEGTEIENLAHGSYDVRLKATETDFASAVFNVSVNTVGKYVIRFVDYNGDVLQSMSVAVGEMPEYTMENPTRAQDDRYTYIFSGWSPEITEVSEAATYTAQYTREPRTYTVTLELDGGTINSGNVTEYTYGTAVVLPTDVTKDGYTFDGWYDDTDTKVTEISDETTGDKTYTAKWTQIKQSEYIEAIGIFKDKITIEKISNDDNTVTLVISPNGNNELPILNMFTAVYKQDKTLKNVTLTPCVVNDGKITLTLTVPSVADDETYKIMLWTDKQEPLIKAIIG